MGFSVFSLQKGLVFLLLLSLSCSLFAGTIFVKQDATGTGDGGSWANAFTDLQPAIDAAVAGDEVWVAAGTYTPTSWPNGGTTVREKHFSLRNNISIYGGFVGTETALDQRNVAANQTVCSGDFDGNDLVTGSGETLVLTGNAENACHVFFHGNGVVLDASALFDGFTVRGGNADAWFGYQGGFDGAAMYNQSSSPTIVSCLFEHNYATKGGAVHNYEESNPRFTDCVFEKNSAEYGGAIYNFSSALGIKLTGCAIIGNRSTYYGGGIDNSSTSILEIYNCSFTGNWGRDGGALSSFADELISIVSSTFLSNIATADGGAVYAYSSTPRISFSVFDGNSATNGGALDIGLPNSNIGPVVISHCEFRNNDAVANGGVIDSSSSGCEIEYCSFDSNNAAADGGAIYNTTFMYVSSSTFSTNTAAAFAGALFSNALTSLTNCTFVQNSADSGGCMWNQTGSNPIITNCTFTGNTATSMGGGLGGNYFDGILMNSIVWGNSAPVGSNLYFPVSISEVSYSIVQGGISGTNNLDQDPLLQVLGDNGGAVKTVGIAATSPAINWGTATDAPATDARGVPRPQDGGFDVGAYEYTASSVYTVAFNAAVNGTVSGPSPQYILDGGTSAPMTATPDTGYIFAGWAGDYTGTDNPLTLTNVTGDMSVSAQFNPNLAPTADDQTVTTDEDTPIAITLTATDPETDPIEFSIVANPTNGALSGTLPDLTYTPTADFNGSDSFTFKANDSLNDSNVATISITVNSVNDIPVAADQMVTLDEDTSIAITLTATDGEGDPLTFSIGSGPANGLLTGTAPNVTYTPNPNYSGTDSFTFTANDTFDDSNVATVSITILEDAIVTVNGATSVIKGATTALSSSTQDGTDNSFTWWSSNPLIASVDSAGVVTGVSVGTVWIRAKGNDTGMIGQHRILVFPATGATWSQVSVQNHHTVALRSDGSLWAWGLNTWGQLGDGTVADKYIPTRIGLDNDWAQTTAGSNQTLAIKNDGSLWAWGYGPLGTGSSGPYHTPTRVGTDTNWRYVITGGTHTAAIKTDGTLWAWGQNSSGQIGDGTYTRRNSPTLIQSQIGWLHVAVGNWHTVAIKADGSLWAWGQNSDGQLGDGTRIDRRTPVQIGSDKDWSVVRANYLQSFSIKSDGSLWAWGWNSSGLLGTETVTLRYTSPIQVGAGTTWCHLSPGNSHTLAIDANGTLWGWGGNVYGELGIEDLSTQINHITIGTAGSWYDSAGGWAYSCALKTDGSLWAMGRNRYGNLGDRTTTDRHIPTLINPLAAEDHSLGVRTNMSVSIDLVAESIFGDSLTYNIVSGPSNGSLTGSAPNLTYTPNTDYSGNDSFTFKANDGIHDSNVATVSISVNAVNSTPTADAQSMVMARDVPKAITLTGSDPDSDPLTYSIVADPVNGTLSGTVPNLTYTPNTGYSGSDSFTFKVNDGDLDSAVATVDISVWVPFIISVKTDNTGISGDDQFTLPLTVGSTYDFMVDFDGQSIAHSSDTDLILTFPSGPGTYDVAIYGTFPQLYFQNNDDNSKVLEVKQWGDIAWETMYYAFYNCNNLQVTATDAPDLSGVTSTRNMFWKCSGMTSIDVTGWDVSNVTDMYEMFRGCTSMTTYTGINTWNVGNVQTFEAMFYYNRQLVSLDLTGWNTSSATTMLQMFYRCDKLTNLTGYENWDVSNVTTFYLMFEKLAQTSLDLSNWNTASLKSIYQMFAGSKLTEIVGLENFDVANLTTATGVFANSTFQFGTPQYDALLIAWDQKVITPPASTVTFDARLARYTPGGAAEAARTSLLSKNWVILDDGPYNALPVADDQAVPVTEDVPKDIVLTASDGENDPLEYFILTSSSNGVLSGTAPNLTYTPNPNYYGSDSFTFKVNDGRDDSNVATVSITVNSVNDIPAADDQSLTVEKNFSLPVTLTATDVEDDVLSYMVVDPPGNGILTGTAPELTYTPNADYGGADSFTFKVNDGSDDSNIATIFITVNPAPTALDQTVKVEEDGFIPITLRTTRTNDAGLVYSLVGMPTSGSLTGTVPNVTYTPNSGFTGTDSFTFKATDTGVDSNIATITINVVQTLVAHYEFDDAAQRWKDSTPYANHGAPLGTPSIVSGTSLDGAEFDGTNYVSVPDAVSLDIPDEVTLMGWIWVNDATGDQNLIQKGNNYALFEIRGGGTPANVLNIGGSWYSYAYTQPASYFAGSWHHVAMTYDGTTVTNYIDGIVDGTFAQTGLMSVNADPAALGANAPWYDAKFKGKVDDARIYRRALSAEEIGAVVGGEPTPIADINLPAGISLIGYTGESTVDSQTAFQGLINNNQLALVRWVDPTNGQIKELYYTTFPSAGWVNEIGDLNLGQGYVVKATSACTLSISGNKSTASVSHNLPAGYSIIGFNQETPMDAQSAFQPLIDAGALAVVRWVDPSNGAIKELYYTTFPSPGWVNEIGNLTEGQGYIIKLNAAHNGFTLP